jgi:16S rRNA (uracil1498-N3)-methyltransferase
LIFHSSFITHHTPLIEAGVENERLRSLRRFIIDEVRPEQGLVSIKGQEARHISRVLRIGPGDKMILMDRKGARFLAEVESAGPNEVTAWIREPLQSPLSSPTEIALCQALLRSAPMDLVIQKTSELGVSQIFPFLSERTVVKPDERGKASKLRHWEEIAKGASKQSDRDKPPLIHPVIPFTLLVKKLKAGRYRKLILWEGEETRDLKDLIRDRDPDTGVVGIVGPEGGFAAGEIEEAVSAGFAPVSMGRRILRAETAAVAFVAVLQYEWGDLSLSRPLR